MTIIPDYYRDFHCIADRCRHNCCIGWEIDIDRDTYGLYTAVDGSFGKRLQDGIIHETQPCFRLTADARCVFLNEQGLCDIVLTLGKEALCDICTDHPRFRTYIEDDLRLGIGMCCEEACRLILASSTRFINAETGESVAVDTVVPSAASSRSPAEWAAMYRPLERMDTAWDAYLDALAACSAFTKQRDAVWERLTAYFMFRHDHAAFAHHAASVILTISQAIHADFDELCEICRLYSAEIEYSDENLGMVMNFVQNTIL